MQSCVSKNDSLTLNQFLFSVGLVNIASGAEHPQKKNGAAIDGLHFKFGNLLSKKDARGV